nr:hypothetical protein [Archaeoglobus neptunius]
MLEEGAKVVAYDPKAMKNFKQLFPEIEYASSGDYVVENSDAVLIVMKECVGRKCSVQSSRVSSKDQRVKENYVTIREMWAKSI